MIDRQRIMDGTRQGLDILLDLYPQARDCVGTKKMFKMRLSEKTPSATIRQNKAGEWVVHDFGGSDEDLNGIDAWMRERGFDRSRFGPAVQAIAQEFGIHDELSRDTNFARVVERAAREDEVEGQWYYEIRDFTDRELKILGPGVTADDCRSLNWYALEWIGKVKDRRMKEFHSCESFPIFMRECFIDSPKEGQPDRFYKVYRPYEPDKRWRFMYFPEGAKPRDYINGLQELRREHRRLNKEASEQAGDDKEYSTRPVSSIEKRILHGIQRYYRVVLCSGERDALCIRARGDFPVWLNSETTRLDWQDYTAIIRLAGELTNIPDLDDTGIAAGSRQALKFMEMKTVWLPESLRDRRDNRGRPCKDFRDWCQHNPSEDDYYDLMDTAAPAKFWTTRTTKDGDRRHRIDALCLHQFLRMQGFHVLRDENAAEPTYIRIKDNIVYRKQPRDMREFVRLWAAGASDPDDPRETLRRDDDARIYLEHGVRNLILTDVAFSPAYLSALSSVSPDFTSCTARTQDFFFRNGVVHCHPQGYDFSPFKENALSTNVWSQNVIPHDFRKAAPMFRITQPEGERWADGTPRYCIEVLDGTSSHYFGYLINASRLFWRQEVEDPFPGQPDLQREYLRLHPFDIAGDHLTERQRDDQARCLINKIFTLGYLMHAYKDPSRTWAPYAMDNRIADGSDANGRSGKSFFFKAFEILGITTAKLSGRNDHLMDNPHVFDQVTRFTRIIQVDDLSQRVQAKAFYDIISGDMVVNPKNQQSFTIPFADSPKFAFTTNYVPGDFDPSSDARLLYMTFSDYYHQRTADNPFGYQETRSIRDDFDKNLFGTFYTADEWNADLNFLMQCQQFYLSVCHLPVKIQPPMDNILQRKLKADMGEAFEEWAAGYFSEDGPNVNRQLSRESVFRDFQNDTKLMSIKTKGFTLRLRAFAQYCPWIHELNPSEYCNTQGRNMATSTDAATGEKRLVEMIHMRTVKEEQRLQQQADSIWNAPEP